MSSIMYRNKVVDMNAVNILHDVLSEEYNTSPETLHGMDKRRRTIMARAMACTLLRDTFKISFREVGRLLSKNRSTAARLYQFHQRYYSLNYQGYRWDFLSIATEFKGRYYSETNRNTQENTR
jgi:hypothetical protein